jgi:hypothetical protein
VGRPGDNLPGRLAVIPISLTILDEGANKGTGSRTCRTAERRTPHRPARNSANDRPTRRTVTRPFSDRRITRRQAKGRNYHAKQQLLHFRLLQ